MSQNTSFDHASAIEALIRQIQETADRCGNIQERASFLQSLQTDLETLPGAMVAFAAQSVRERKDCDDMPDDALRDYQDTLVAAALIVDTDVFADEMSDAIDRVETGDEPEV